MKIKYRIWDKKYQNWEDPTEFGLNFNGELSWDESTSQSKASQFVPQAFTGMKDRNGRDIYEGDIVKGYRKSYDGLGYDFDLESEIGKIYYSEDNACYGMGDYKLFVYKNLEVIGNIFENKELLL